MEDGFKYLFTQNGILKILAVAFSCTTFALYASSTYGPSSPPENWVLAAFIISFSISFLFLFFRVVGMSSKMQCGNGPCSYDGFDFVWAWFCTGWTFAASITFAVNFPDPSDSEAIVSIVFAFLTFIVYALEAYFLRVYAPANIGFVATLPGWIKTCIVVFGACTFGLMVDSGYPDTCTSRSDGCVEGLTYALVAFTVSWSVTTLMWIAHLAGPTGSIEGNENLKKAEIVWAILGVLFFWSGASVLAVYMSKQCSSYENNRNCQKRLSGVLAGFLTGLLYLIEMIVLK